MLGALSVVVACIAGGATAQAQTRDLWQTYMEAAVASDEAGEFTLEAVTLNAALAFARAHDPDGQRPLLSRLPLMLAYGELGRSDLFRPLAAVGLHLDPANLDARHDAYVATASRYASSYFGRFNGHADDKNYDASRQAIRLYGAKYSYLIEIAVRAKLMPEDRIGLANAMALAGLAYQKNDDFDCAAYDYARAVQTFQDFERLREVMLAAGTNFTIGRSTAAGDGQGASGQVFADTEAALTEILATDMRLQALRTLNSPSDDPSGMNKDMSTCDSFGPPGSMPPAVGFDAQVARALEYVDTGFKLSGQLHAHWPDNARFGWLHFNRAMIYELEFRMAKTHPGQYPDALAMARKSYDDALTILAHAHGPNSSYARRVALAYVDLLVDARMDDEATKIETRYAVTRSAPSPSAASKKE